MFKDNKIGWKLLIGRANPLPPLFSKVCNKIIFCCCRWINYLTVYLFNIILGGIHPIWSYMTIMWMFSPFLMEGAIVFLQKEKRKDWKIGLKEAMVHLPMIVPLKNAYHTFQLYEIDYSHQMSIESRTKVENLKMIAGKLTVNEAFTVRNKLIHLNSV